MATYIERIVVILSKQRAGLTYDDVFSRLLRVKNDSSPRHTFATLARGVDDGHLLVSSDGKKYRLSPSGRAYFKNLIKRSKNAKRNPPAKKRVSKTSEAVKRKPATKVVKVKKVTHDLGVAKVLRSRGEMDRDEATLAASNAFASDPNFKFSTIAAAINRAIRNNYFYVYGDLIGLTDEGEAHYFSAGEGIRRKKVNA